MYCVRSLYDCSTTPRGSEELEGSAQPLPGSDANRGISAPQPLAQDHAQIAFP